MNYSYDDFVIQEQLTVFSDNNYSEANFSENDNSYNEQFVLPIINNQDNANLVEKISKLNIDITDDITNDNYGEVILNTYKSLLSDLEKFKKELSELNKNKKDFFDYQQSLFTNHFTISKIFTAENNVDYENSPTKLFINYNDKIKTTYDYWIVNIYEPKKTNLEKNIDITEDKIIHYRKLFHFLINNFISVDEVKQKKMCPICFDNEIDMCAVPCGHTCCNKCVISSRSSRSINKNNCISCRNKINNYIKIYFLI